MKLLIKKAFRDKITMELYKEGTVVEFEDERGKEILADPRDLASESKKRVTKKK